MSSDEFRSLGKQTFENLSTYSEEPAVAKLCRRIGGFVSAFGADVSSFIRMLKREVKLIRSTKRERSIFTFITITLAFVVLEIFYAYTTENLSMIAHAFHTSYSNIKLLVILLSFTLPKHHRATSSYNYGVSALEVLFWFTNAIFHIFVCIFIWYEALERFMDYEHQEESHVSMAVVVIIGCVGFLLNFTNTGMVDRFRNRNSELYRDNWTVLNLAVANALITFFVIISYEFSNSVRGLDSIIALATSLFILYEAIPAFLNSAKVLLQTTPVTLQDKIYRDLEAVRRIEGVIEYHSPHFWTQSTGEYVGSVAVRVRESTDTHTVLTAVHHLFDYIDHLTVQVDAGNAATDEQQALYNTGNNSVSNGGHGHSHGGGKKGHGHSHGEHEGHGHSHGGAGGHEEEEHEEEEEGHGHSHGGGEHEGHGHSHGGGKKGHGHSHGGGHNLYEDDHEH